MIWLTVSRWRGPTITPLPRAAVGLDEPGRAPGESRCPGRPERSSAPMTGSSPPWRSPEAPARDVTNGFTAFCGRTLRPRWSGTKPAEQPLQPRPATPWLAPPLGRLPWTQRQRGALGPHIDARFRGRSHSPRPLLAGPADRHDPGPAPVGGSPPPRTKMRWSARFGPACGAGGREASVRSAPVDRPAGCLSLLLFRPWSSPFPASIGQVDGIAMPNPLHYGEDGRQ